MDGWMVVRVVDVVVIMVVVMVMVVGSEGVYICVVSISL